MKFLQTGLQNYSGPKVIKEATVKDFSGGLDLSDDDLNINSRYAKALTNMYRSRDGRLRLRYGFAPVAVMPGTTTGNIIATEYFAGCVIAATDAGEIVAFPVNGMGTITKLWPTGVAGKTWSTGLTRVNFTQSQGEMIIVNGQDKPLRLKSTFAIDFLGDPANGNSNVNTPIAPFAVTCKNYVVMAGQLNAPSKLYISSKGTTGVYSGDTAPNDATTLDVGGAIGHGDNIIVGLSALNNYVFVAFETSTVVVELGNYAGTVHTPNIFDTFDTYGAVSHKSMIIVDKELWYCDQTGVLKFGRNQLGTTFIPDRTSAFVDPILLQHLWAARSLGNIGKTFAVFNRLASQYMLFIPSSSGANKHCWVTTRYSPDEPPSWSLFEGLNFVVGCVSSIGRLYLATARGLFVYGDINNEMFSDNGVSINFEWELPWSVFQAYDQIKKTKAIRIYTRGTATFLFQIFVDYIYKDKLGQLDPAAQIEFAASDVGGYGDGSGSTPYGGGRSAGDPRIWKIDAKFIQAKMRLSGSTVNDIQVVGLSLAYTVGGRKR